MKEFVKSSMRPVDEAMVATFNRSMKVRVPFTRDPVVHLLPAGAADAVTRLTGWQHNHGRVRLLSAPALRRMLRQGGFDRVEIGTMRGARVTRPPRAYVGRFYAAVARRGE